MVGFRIPRLRARGRMRLGVALLCAGMIAIASGVVWIAPDYLMSATAGNVAEQARSGENAETEAPTDEEAAAAGAAVATEAERSASGIDWSYLQAENGQVRSWISVPSKDIDYPVMHGSNNEYYLHHDMYGRWGYGGVFTDYRCDPNGRNVIVYGHTLIGGGMFTKLGVADEPGQLGTIGEVTYSTPEAGATTFTPIATMHVYPSFQDVQQFSWDVSDEQLEAALRAVARDKAEAGEWNVELPEDQQPAGEYMVDWFSVNNGTVDRVDQSVSDTDSSEEVPVSRYYVVTKADTAEARARAEKGAWRDWLVSLCEQSTQVSPDAASRISSASRSLVLACCSWPFDSHRTLVICVA